MEMPVIIPHAWDIPNDYQRREIFLGERVRVEIEAKEGNLLVWVSGEMTEQETEDCLDWQVLVINGIRKELER